MGCFLKKIAKNGWNENLSGPKLFSIRWQSFSKRASTCAEVAPLRLHCTLLQKMVLFQLWLLASVAKVEFSWATKHSFHERALVAQCCNSKSPDTAVWVNGAQGVGMVHHRSQDRQPLGPCACIPPLSHCTRALECLKNKARRNVECKDVGSILTFSGLQISQ